MTRPVQTSPGNDILVGIFEQALLARMFEARILKLTKEGFFPPMLHPGAGHEVAQIAAVAALDPADPILYSHRGLAYMVARGVSLAAMLSDLAGRTGGTNNGKGGIMHVVDVERGIYGESGTLGGGMVVAVGIGMALRKRRSANVVIHFFGDGASNRGTFHEALNWAAVQRLPCIYVCENNGWAVSVPTSKSTSVDDIALRAAGYGIPGVTLDGSDPDGIYRSIGAARARARAGDGPTLIEIKTTRLLGHYAADLQDYRDDADHLTDRDPLEQLRRRLLDGKVMTSAEVARLEADHAHRIEVAVEEVRSAAPMDAKQAFTDLFA